MIKTQTLLKKLCIITALLGLLVNSFSMPVAAVANAPVATEIDNVHYQALDKADQPIPNAQIRLVAMSGQHDAYNLTADNSGYFTTALNVTTNEPATHINPGRYQLTAIAPPTGYQLEGTVQIVEIKANDANQAIVRYQQQATPEGHLTVQAVDQANQSLADILLTATNLDTQQTTTLPVTDVHGQTTAKLAAGQYQIAVKSANGYTPVVAMPTVTVTNAESTTETIQFKKQVGTLTATLVDQKTQQPVKDVQFKVINVQSQTTVGTATTNQAGQVTFTNLAVGQYTIEPTGQAATGLLTVPAKQTVDIKNATTTTTVFQAYQPRGQLQLNSLSSSGVKIPNVQYQLESSDQSISKRVQTDQNGQLTLNDLRLGEYTITETAVPNGYQLTNTTQKVLVTSDQTAIVNFEHQIEQLNQRHPLVLKTQNYMGEPLSGVHYRIKLVSGLESYEQIVTTDATGQVKRTKLPVGQYQITQLSAPKGYQVTNQPTVMTVSNHQTNQVTKKVKREVTAVTFKVINQTTKKPLAHAQVQVKTAVKDDQGQNTFTTQATNQAGEVTLPAVPTGKLVYQQVATADGYVVDDQRHEVSITAEHQYFTLENTMQVPVTTGQIRVFKTDMQGFSLDSARFKLTNLADGTSQLKTTHGGQLTFTDLAAGQYQITEIQAPKGYQINADVKTVTVDPKQRATTVVQFADQRQVVAPTHPLTIQTTDDQGRAVRGAVFELEANQPDDQGQTKWRLKTNAHGNLTLPQAVVGQYKITEVKVPAGYTVSQTSYRLMVEQYGANRLTVVHQPVVKQHALQIVKTDLQNKRLAGAVFSVKATQSTANYQVTSHADGITEIGDIPAGQYVVREIVAPKGYRLATKAHFVTIKPHQAKTKITVQDEPEAGQLVLNKTNDAHEALAGAYFDVKNAAGQLIGNFKTDATGQVKLSQLMPGEYTIQETKAPTGYQLNPKTFQVTITDQQTTTQTIIDQKVTQPVAGLLSLTNQDAKLKTALVGGTFRIETAAGQVVKTQVTIDQNGQAVVSDLVPGDYRVIQITAATAYLKATQAQSFTITSNALTKVTVANQQQPGSVIINQIDGNTNRPLAGAKFELQSLTGQVLISNLVSDERGQVVMSYLPPATYRLVEVQAPEGYGTLKEPVVFKITGGIIRLF